MSVDLQAVVSAFGGQAKAKLHNPSATGEPEDQLRAPLEVLVQGIAGVMGLTQGTVSLVGEHALSELKTRPDYAVTVSNALTGFIEVKTPGKGADPRRFRGHDKQQWSKLRSLPNLLYTDGNQFSLWRDGSLVGEIVRLVGDIETSGTTLAAPPGFQLLFEDFLQWEPAAPRSVRQLAETSARLCRLLRDEVTEQLDQGTNAFASLEKDWRQLLFPDASPEQFADGYAQAVTFGLLMARARDIALNPGLHEVARQLGHSNSLIGAALRLLTDNDDTQEALKTSLGTLTRVLDVVNWPEISKGDPDAWLYFYEDFLTVYDNALRKATGSYYTPNEVVTAMVRLVHEVLVDCFGRPDGIASGDVTLADPAMGTGTFLLGVLRQIASVVEADQGAGAVPAAIEGAVDRLIAFELQFGPFAVAQLRLMAEMASLTGHLASGTPRVYVADTLGNPEASGEHVVSMVEAIAASRLEANKIKRRERITVVMGNPPYKEKAKGRGGWVEANPDLLAKWFPPKGWGVGAHVKHLRNLYVYFWRWATWKAFDQFEHDEDKTGIVCFITVAGFLNGPGFQRMREYLRQRADDIWVIDCSPEGHQPEVASRVFQGVQQPVCIVLASRTGATGEAEPARVRYWSLPVGPRDGKFAALADLTLATNGWEDCSTEWRSAFLPAAADEWAGYPGLGDLFAYNGSGVMPGRTWVIAPDAETLRRRWAALAAAPPERKQLLFQPHLRRGLPGDKHCYKPNVKPLHGHSERLVAVADDHEPCEQPITYGYRSFDRQWILPDSRVINQPNPGLWQIQSPRQVYLAAPSDRSPSGGPALTFSALLPDLHHYNGRGGRVYPLWRHPTEGQPNCGQGLLAFLTEAIGAGITADDVFAYIAAMAAHPAYTARFLPDLVQPGLRVPLTGDAGLFREAVKVGRRVIWLHTFGERYVDKAADRPAGPPRLPTGQAPRVPADGAIPSEPGRIPDSISYDPALRRLTVGEGYIAPVAPEVWAYEVSGQQVLTQWFSYRSANRERPVMGDRRPPSELCGIQPDHWLPEYTLELLNVINVLGHLVALEPKQADLLRRVCEGPLISVAELRAANALPGHITTALADPLPQMRLDLEGDLH